MAKGVRRRNGSWQLRCQVAGTLHEKTISGPDTKAGLKAAERHRADWVRQIKDGVVTEIPQFSSVAQSYLNQCDIKLSTYNSYRQLLNQFWMPAFGNLQIDRIRPSMIRKALGDHNVSQKTKSNALIPLNQVMQFAVEEEFIDSNPAISVKIRKHQKPPVFAFSPAEKARILSKLDGDALLFYQIAFETGMRTGEILALRWEDWTGSYINVEKAFVRCRLTSIKNHQSRRIYVAPALMPHLSKHPGRLAGGYIFRNKNGGPHLDAKHFCRAWKEALRRSQIAYKRPYCCRHTRASALLMAGVKPAYAAGQLGHTVAMFFKAYATWINDVDDKTQEAMLEAM